MTDKDYLILAINQAKESVKRGGFPAGAVIVKNGKIIAKGVARGYILNDPTSHDTTNAIRNACNKLKTSNLQGAVLYTSMHPCLMCFSACVWAGISRVVYACNKKSEFVKKHYYEGKTDVSIINKENNNKIEMIYISDFEKDVVDLISSWERTFE